MLNKVLSIMIFLFLISCSKNEKKTQDFYPRNNRVGIKKLFKKYSSEVTEKKEKIEFPKDELEKWGRYKEFVIEAPNKDINFGGRYILIHWGCGTECQTGALIDSLTGKTYRLPTSEWTVEYQKDSSLLIINPPSKALEKDNKRPDYAYPAYYLWKNNKFNLLYDTRKKEK